MITSAEWLDDSTIKVTLDDGTAKFVPDDMANADRQALEEWITQEGGEIRDYVALAKTKD